MTDEVTGQVPLTMPENIILDLEDTKIRINFRFNSVVALNIKFYWR